MNRNANQYIEHRGDSWVITQKGTGKVLSHHDSEEEAEASFRAMEMNKHGSEQRKSAMSYNEDDYRLGWALASSDSPLPAKPVSRSFLSGYAEYLKNVLADHAPGYDTIAPIVDGKTRSVGDVLDDKKTIADPTDAVRSDLAQQLDSTNAEGQGQSNDTQTDLSGWRTSALIEEISRRIR